MRPLALLLTLFIGASVVAADAPSRRPRSPTTTTSCRSCATSASAATTRTRRAAALRPQQLHQAHGRRQLRRRRQAGRPGQQPAVSAAVAHQREPFMPPTSPMIAERHAWRPDPAVDHRRRPGELRQQGCRRPGRRSTSACPAWSAASRTGRRRCRRRRSAWSRSSARRGPRP